MDLFLLTFLTLLCTESISYIYIKKYVINKRYSFRFWMKWLSLYSRPASLFINIHIKYYSFCVETFLMLDESRVRSNFIVACNIEWIFYVRALFDFASRSSMVFYLNLFEFTCPRIVSF